MAEDAPECARHSTGAFSVPVPAGWELTEDPSPAVAAVLRAPHDGWAFRANAVVTIDALAPVMTLRDWSLGTEHLLRRTLVDYHLLDLEHVQIDDLPGVRRLAHHTAPGGHAVTVEQWAVLAGSTGYSLATSMFTPAYPLTRATLTAMACGLRIHARGEADGER